MNTVDCYVTKILGRPYFKYNKWWLSVQYCSYGQTGNTVLMFNRFEDAIKVQEGYKFLG